jgi:hypothetical protein
MNKITKPSLFAIFALLVCACSDESSGCSDVNGPDARSSSSSQELSSGEEADIFVEYVEPPTLSCENVESILVDSELDSSYYFSSIGFYGENVIAVPYYFSKRGLVGHEDDPDSAPIYIKKNGDDSWQSVYALENDSYNPTDNKICIVGNHLAFVRSSDKRNEGSEYEICHSADAEKWDCTPSQGKTWLTCDDEYFYKSDDEKLYYSKNAEDWSLINYKLGDMIEPIFDAFSNDSAHFIVVSFFTFAENRADRYTALLYSKDMDNWDTNHVMGGLSYSLVRFNDLYIMSLDRSYHVNGNLYYSKDLKNWIPIKSVNDKYNFAGSTLAVSKGVLVVVGDGGGYGSWFVLASRNGKDFKEQCGGGAEYVRVFSDTLGNFYALRRNDFGSYGKYDIFRVVE